MLFRSLVDQSSRHQVLYPWEGERQLPIISEVENTNQHGVLTPWNGQRQLPYDLEEQDSSRRHQVRSPWIAGREIPYLIELINDTDRNRILYPWVAVENIDTGELAVVQEYQGVELAPYQEIRSDRLVLTLPTDLDSGDYAVRAFLVDDQQQVAQSGFFLIQVDRPLLWNIPEH